MKCINYFCTTLLLFLENYHQLIREVVLDRFVNRSCVSSKHTTQKLQSSLNWLTFPYNDGWYDYSTTAAALSLRNMQLFNNSFPAFSLKGRLEFLLASMRIISICVGVLTRGSGSQLVNAACFLVPDDDAIGNTVTHGLSWFWPRGRTSSKGGVRGHCIILHPECL